MNGQADRYDPPTVTGIFLQQARRYGERTLKLSKRNGCWTPTTWREALAGLRAGVMGLVALGAAKGDPVGIMSRTRAEWADADLAILSAGGVTIGLYPTASLKETTHIIRHSGLRRCFAEDDAILETLLSIRETLGQPETLVVFATRRTSLPPGVLTWEDFKAEGRILDERAPERFEAICRAVKPEDLATIAYTSGTTGPPKGAMITHANLYHTVLNATRMHRYEESDFGLAFLPLTHMLQRMTVYAAMHLGIVGAYAESIDRLVDNFRELKPTVQVSVPKIFERIYNRIQQMLAGGSPLKARIFRWAVDVGRRAARVRREGRRLPPGLALAHALAHRLVFRKIHAVFGGRVKYLLCGGAPMSLYLLEFFEAVGLLILEGYGLTETVAPVAVNRAERYKLGTVGQLIPGMAAKIGDDGELLLKGKGLFQGYYRDPEATAAAIDGEGWFHTGDLATLDAEGFITITDRKKDLIVTAGGKNVAPQNIEDLLRALPLISQAVVLGDRRKYLAALVTLHDDEVRALAGRDNLSSPPPALLTDHPRLRQRVADHIAAVNAGLAPHERIRRFRILPRDFTEADGELTPTLKIRRREISRRYEDVIEALYADPPAAP